MFRIIVLFAGQALLLVGIAKSEQWDINTLRVVEEAVQENSNSFLGACDLSAAPANTGNSYIATVVWEKHPTVRELLFCIFGYERDNNGPAPEGAAIATCFTNDGQLKDVDETTHQFLIQSARTNNLDHRAIEVEPSAYSQFGDCLPTFLILALQSYQDSVAGNPHEDRVALKPETVPTTIRSQRDEIGQLRYEFLKNLTNPNSSRVGKIERPVAGIRSTPSWSHYSDKDNGSLTRVKAVLAPGIRLIKPNAPCKLLKDYGFFFDDWHYRLLSEIPSRWNPVTGEKLWKFTVKLKWTQIRHVAELSSSQLLRFAKYLGDDQEPAIWHINKLIRNL